MLLPALLPPGAICCHLPSPSFGGVTVMVGSRVVVPAPRRSPRLAIPVCRWRSASSMLRSLSPTATRDADTRCATALIHSPCSHHGRCPAWTQCPTTSIAPSSSSASRSTCTGVDRAGGVGRESGLPVNFLHRQTPGSSEATTHPHAPALNRKIQKERQPGNEAHRNALAGM